MPTRLYPPQINGTLPAFFKSYDASTGVLKDTQITIPFTASALVSEADIVGFSLRLKTSSTNTYLFEPIESTNYDIANSTVTFTIAPSKGSLLNEGQYYKIQIAYISKYVDTETIVEDEDGEVTTSQVFRKLTGYYSTVGVIKCVQKPIVSIKGYSIDSINLFNNEIFGLYELSSNYDQTEKVYSYNFSFYTEDGELYYSTGELLHNNSNDSEYGLSIDSVILSSFIKTSEVYKLVYTVTTINGLIVSSSAYRVTAETLLPPSKTLSITPIAQPDSGSIKINFQGTEHITRQENVVQEMIRKEIYYKYDDELKRRLTKFYYGSDIPNNNPMIKKYVSEIRAPGAAENETLLSKYRQYLKNNLNLLNEMCGISTGVLESLFAVSKEYMLYLGDYLEKVINNIGKQNENQTYNELYTQFIKDTTTYIITQSNGYKGLTETLQIRLKSYIAYLLDLIDKDETFIDANVTDQTILTLSQTIVSTAELSTELSLEYLNILGYDAKIVYEAEKLEDTYFGQYMLVRASEEDDYRSWIELKRFKLENMRPSLVNYIDYTVKQGVKYIYGIVQYNLFGIYSSRIESDPISVDFEDIFLYDGERILKVKFNPKVSSFKTTILEQKTNTIGNKYPFIFRNGNVAYKEFPISGLISYQMDDELLFYDYEINEYFRECTENSNRSNSEEFFANMAQLLENPCDLIENNIHKERDFKTEVLDWLNNGKPKLFKSGPEGNFIVRIMNVSLSPIDTLGRMLHSFSGQCSEIAEFNYNNLLRYGFIKADIVNKYVSLWKSYYLNEYKPGKDIELYFESNINNFSVQDLMPGSSIFLTYGDVSSDEEEEIVIGITGAYSYDSSRLISKIRIPNSIENHPVGILECQYRGTRYGAFDAITSMSLKTILSNQFIGVNPILDELSTFKSQSQFLSNADIEKFNNAIKSINDRIILNQTANNVIERFDTLNEKGFEAGDIIQHINAAFYNYEKSKIRILNLEQLNIKVRELIPVYAVPYDYISAEGWAKLPNSVTYWISNGQSTGSCEKRLDGTFTRQDYETRFPSQNLLYSVTPFGQPYPIDELMPILKEYFDINDEFCVFHLYEFFPKFNTWMPTQRKNIFGVKTGEYYDCYWQSVVSSYDTSYYIDDKYRYEKIDEIFYDEENSQYYTVVQNQKKIFSDNLDLFVKYNGKYVAANSIYYFPTYINEDGSISYYTNIKNDDSLIDDLDYLSTAVKWLDKNNYNSIPNYYHNNWTIDENNQARSIVREADMKDFYLRYDNSLQLEYGNDQHFTNLGSPSVIKIGTGLIAEATFQLEILDYYTEKNHDETFKAKEDYINKAEFLKNFYRNFELIAEADSNFQRYLTLARMYRTLLEGLIEKANIPYEDINTHQSNYASKINLQDRSVTNSILNSDKPGESQNTTIATVWSSNSLTEGKKQEIKKQINENISRLQINSGMKAELNLQDEEEEDLLDLIQHETKEGINAKLAKLDELYKTLLESKNNTVSESQNYISEYVNLLNKLKTAIDSYNNSIYTYKATYWLYCLIYWKLGKKLKESIPNGKTLQTLTDTQATELEAKLSINDILISISNHYNKVLGSSANASSSVAEELNIQKNYYISAQSAIKTAVAAIQTYHSIMNDKKGDSALDELLLEKVSENVIIMLVQYYRAKKARENLYSLLGRDIPITGEDELFINQLSIADESYYLENLAILIQSIKDLILNDEDPDQITPAKLAKKSMSQEIKVYYNSLYSKLQNNNGILGFTDENIEEIKAYIEKVDTMDYSASAMEDLNWSHTYGNRLNPVEQSIKYNYNIGLLSAVEDELYIKETVLRERILNTFKCADKNAAMESYIATVSSSGQSEIRNSRIAIPSLSDNIINDGDSELYISKDFDDNTIQTTEGRSIKRKKITVLVNLIDNLKKEAIDKNYKQILDSLSNSLSSYGEIKNGKIENGIIASLVQNCYDAVLKTTGDLFNSILIQYNDYIKDCQDKFLTNADFNERFLIGNISEEDYKHFVINGKSHWYTSLEATTVDNGKYINSQVYYLNLRDYLLKGFIDYYMSLTVAEQDRKTNYNAYYNILVGFLTDKTKIVGFSSAKETLFNITQFYETKSIFKEGDIVPGNILLEKSIKFTNDAYKLFKGETVSGTNALKELPNAVKDFNALIPDNRFDSSIKITETIKNFLRGYHYYNTSTESRAWHRAFTNSYTTTDPNMIVLNDEASGKINSGLTIPTKLSETGASINNKNSYLLLLDRASKVAGLYYWANISRFEEYRLDTLFNEFYTNNIGLNGSTLRDNDYPEISATGIVYWYIQYVINKEVNALEEALKQAEALNTIYTNKQKNYQDKQKHYEKKYKEYLTVYKNFLGSDYSEYYKSDANKKDALMRELIEGVRMAWYEFILALDRGFTEEIKAGMYQ